ncbi:hypothetical protein MBLNU457_5542t1 [Dothideomycetes sp. NU457]
MASKPLITHATREDVPAIASMIQELADYEDASDSNHATHEKLLNTLCFAPDMNSPASGPGYAKTLIVRIPTGSSTSSESSVYQTPHGEIVAMAMYFNNYSTWHAAPGIYLEDLYVRKPYRGKGHGTSLLKALAKEVDKIGGKRLEWSCLKWNEPSLKFYRSIGAEEMQEWVGLRADGDALMKLAGEAEQQANVKGV